MPANHSPTLERRAFIQASLCRIWAAATTASLPTAWASGPASDPGSDPASDPASRHATPDTRREAAIPRDASGSDDDAAPPRLMLAQDAPAHIDPTGWLVSEKLDGVRALWTGRVLRLRGGGTVAAPAWFTARLPPVALDGELWAGRGRFEAASATARRQTPRDAEWHALRYMAFDLPGASGPFADRARQLVGLAAGAGAAASAVWLALPQRRVRGREALMHLLADVVAAGGEGLMLHRADALWVPGRSSRLLKLKPLHDADAVVVAHQPGRGRHAGRLGALRVRTPGGVEFDIGTGFSDAERQAPPPPGSVVTYTHRGFTAGGVPRFASFLRLREAP